MSAGTLPQHAAAAEQGQALKQQLQEQLYPTLSSSLWTNYVFLQTEAFSSEQALLFVHDALAASGLFAAASSMGNQADLVGELATSVHQYAGELLLTMSSAALFCAYSSWKCSAWLMISTRTQVGCADSNGRFQCALRLAL